jgi:hypothetical protein
MCTLPQKVAILTERVDSDLQHNNSQLTEGLCRGVVKYLSIKKLQEIYRETGNNIAFEGLKDIFSDFYDLNEVIRGKTISRIRLNRLLGNRNWHIETEESLRAALSDLALTNRDLEYDGNGRTGCVHLVFASKVLHTFDNNLPIVDSFIDRFFCLGYKDYHGAALFEDKCNHVSDCYDRLIGYYNNMEENELDHLAGLFSEIMNNERAFNAGESIENYADAQNHLFDSIRTDNNVLNAVVEYAGDINNINNITTVKKIDFMIWNYWRTIYETINAADLPEDVNLIPGEWEIVKTAFEQMHGQNMISAINYENRASAKRYAGRHSEKFYKIFLVR